MITSPLEDSAFPDHALWHRTSLYIIWTYFFLSLLYCLICLILIFPTKCNIQDGGDFVLFITRALYLEQRLVCKTHRKYAWTRGGKVGERKGEGNEGRGWEGGRGKDGDRKGGKRQGRIWDSPAPLRAEGRTENSRLFVWWKGSISFLIVTNKGFLLVKALCVLYV